MTDPGDSTLLATMRINAMPETQSPRRIALTVGPVLYWWDRAVLMNFYDQVADSAADTVVLGEIVCSRRHDMKLADWLALARELQAAGKEVILATQALVMSEAELRAVREIVAQEEFAVEAGDASALHAFAQIRRERGASRPLVLGPHLNIYSHETLREYAALGARRWVAPVELSLQAIAAVNPKQSRAQGSVLDISTEVWAFGRLPLSFSARCFTARHHHLHKDSCAFRCRDDADGLLLSSSERQPFLCLNGTQVQSAGVQALIHEAAALRQAGVERIRLSPCSQGFIEVIAQFEAVYNHGSSVDKPLDEAALHEALARLRAIGLPGGLVNGYLHQQPGMQFASHGL